MKVSIHQPEHFPYMGFFQKMQACDVFVILDNVKFRKNYFQNRNRFKNGQDQEEWFGFSVPKDSSSKIIKDVIPVDDNIFNWKKKVIKKLEHNFKQDFTSVYENNALVDINMKSIEWARSKMRIDNKIIFASEIGAKGKSSELLSNICREVGAKTYLSGPSGKDYLEEEFFEDIKIEYFYPEVENLYSCIYNLLK